MPRKYYRKSLRATTYTQEDLNAALESIAKGEKSQYAAAKHYRIPVSTLNDRIKGKTRIKSQTLGRPTAIPDEIEVRLANALIILEKWGFGLSRVEIINLVEEFIKLNEIATPFRNGRPGSDWLYNFRKRHGLSIKKPQPIEHVRRQMTDPFIIEEYFNLLEKVLLDLDLVNRPSQVWNLDETSVSLDPSKTKVVGKIGKASSRTTFGTGKENITVLTAVNANGVKLTPLIVFKGKYVWNQWIADVKNEYGFELAYAASKKGWMETDIFRNYMEKVFIPNLGDERPVLLIYDGHGSHVDISVVELATRNGVTILKLPPHTSHLLQPLDVCVFKSFKTRWDAKLVEWQRHNVGVKLPKKEFSKLFAKIWHEINPEIIRNGFKKAGIIPFNRNTIPVEKYDPRSYSRWLKSKSENESCASHHVNMTTNTVQSLNNLCVYAINLYLHQTVIPHMSIPNDTLSANTMNNCLFIHSDYIPESYQEEETVTKEPEVLTKNMPNKIIILSDIMIKPGTSNVHSLTRLSKNGKENTTFVASNSCDLPECLQTPHNLKKPVDYEHTFENLLLERIRQTRPENNKTKRKRVGLGAEIITQKCLENYNTQITTKLKNTKEKKKNKVVNEKQDETVANPKINNKRNKKEQTDNKLKKIKKRKIEADTKENNRQKGKLCDSDSDSSISSLFELADSDEIDYEEYIAELLNQEIDKENDEPNESMGLHDIAYFTKQDELKENDWIVARFATKKSLKHFVGRVLSIDKTIPTVKFLRKVKDSKYNKGTVFTYPIIDDICTIKHSDDIVSILPEPQILRRGQIIFDINFNNFNIQ
ncbi:uncharacterized protein LOC113498807 [Trichoplusia ni]|uniref:Uncharacterized protein LOC113494739 n=1 Tax=Trichoplusia ni TaxID=7111 RepID=A0A7E5W2L1_TRINI|nr:uncharacterized protein LOC113494739 [Trichoplusia ni]XP_026734752.1 uncharacterized protein LOC113498807 [Trichoplusia ni]